jgi:predicted nucleic acid-binding protein
MIYVDTSVLVALHLNETASAAVSRWYGACTDDLISAMWCVTEFASALGIKQRTGQIDAEQAHAAWLQFERLCASELKLLPVEPAIFHHGAVLTLDAETGLRAGDSLHLAAALAAKVKQMATLDDVLAKNAKRMKLKTVRFA